LSAYDYLSWPAATDLNPLTGDFTVEALFYTEIVGVFNPICNKRNGIATSLPGWELMVGNNDKLIATFCDSSATELYSTSTVAITKNQWTRVAMTCDRDGNMLVYQGGVEVGTGDISAQQSSCTNDVAFEVGRRTAGSLYFGGLISEIKYSNIARTNIEIMNSYTEGFTIDSNTVALWRPDSYGIFRDSVSGLDLASSDEVSSSYVYMPRDESIVAKDVSGANMRDIGKVKYNTKLTSNCGTFDGVNDRIIYSADIIDDTTWSVAFRFDNYTNASTDFVLGGYGVGNILFSTSGYIGFRQVGGAYLSWDVQTTEVENTPTSMVVWSDGTEIYLALNGVYKGPTRTTPANTAAQVNQFVQGYDTGDTLLANGDYWDLRVWDGTSIGKAEALLYHTDSMTLTPDHWYPMAEGAGATTYDAVGSINGVVTNANLATFWATQNNFHYNLMGGFSDGVYMDGSTAYGNIPNSDAGDFNPGTGNFTVEIIFSTDTMKESLLFKKYDGSTGYYVGFDGTGLIGMYIKGPGGYCDTWTSSGAITSNTVYSVAGVRLGSSLYFYINGVLASSPLTQTDGLNISNAEDVEVGYFSGESWNLEGNIYKVRYSNKARTPDDILNTYNNGMTVDGSTVALWDFKGGLGIDLAGKIQGVGGAKGNGHNLTMTNTEHIRIPANASDKTIDISGQPIQHLAGGWHNDAESTIDFTGGKDTPFVNNIYRGWGVFNGSSAYINCGDNDLFSFGDGVTDYPFSISAWINMDDATNFSIINKEYGANEGDGREWVLLSNGGDQLVFLLRDDSELAIIGRYLNSPITNYEGVWIHVAATYDGTGTSAGIKIFLNGVRVDDQEQVSGVYVAMENTDQICQIGKFYTYYTDGKIRDVRLYSGELTQGQVNKDYKIGEVISTSTISLIAEYKLHRNARDSGLHSLHAVNTDVTFPKFTVPTAYSFGDTVENPMFKKVEGDVVLEANTTNPGGIFYDSKNAYGVWEFDIRKANETSTINLVFLLDSGLIGYNFYHDNLERITIQTFPALGTLMQSATGSHPINTWYNIRIVRNETANQYVSGAIGTMAVYVNGSLMPVSVGTNPVTDTTTNTSTYMLMGVTGSGDKFRNLKFNGELINYSRLYDITLTDTLSNYQITGDRENSFVLFERGYINQAAMRPIHTYTKSQILDTAVEVARFTTTTSSSTSTSTTSSSTSTTSSSTTSTSTSTTSSSTSSSTT